MSKLNLPPGEPLRLPAQIEYVTGSIVSRTLFNQRGGSLTLFAFDEGQGLSEHTSPYDAFAQVVDGEAEIRVGGKPARVQSGECIVLPAGVPHAVLAVQRFKMLLSMVRE